MPVLGTRVDSPLIVCSAGLFADSSPAGLLNRIDGMNSASGSGKRPIAVVSTEGKTAEQMKADARSALAHLFAGQDRAKDTGS
jgi:hypothetical protein